ncbi:aminoglycoside phosphotransferase family protein [Luteimonas sp. A478]
MTVISLAARAPEAARAAVRLAWARSASGVPDLALERASADAGFRTYWRGRTADGSLIVMDSPPALEDVRPWLRMHAVLEAGGVRVPRVLARDDEAGFLLMEDLGGDTWLQAVDRLDPEATFDLAIDQLLQLQQLECPPDLPAYDAALLQRELDLFEEWYLGRHLGVELDAGEREGLRRVQQLLIESALAQPQVFVHRDYMPRNLMPVDGGLAVLDFQDAVRGPVAYDPVSLVRDAFHSWEPERVRGWLGRYHARAKVAGIPVPELAQFLRDADLIGVQRHLKVLGIFARLNYRDGKPRYLADAERFLTYLAEVIPQYPELAPLAAILDTCTGPSPTAA